MELRVLAAWLLAISLSSEASRMTATTSLALEEAKNTVGSKNGVQKDLVIQGSLHQNWIKLMVPAPTTGYLLSKLGLDLAASATDFKLHTPPEGEFRLLTHPDSFKASLHQVGDWGWKAFSEAHSSMDEIMQRTRNIPESLDNAIEIIVDGGVDDIGYLPYLMDSVISNIRECKNRATGTVAKFAEMSEIVGEILLGTESTKAWAKQHGSQLASDNRIQRGQKSDLDSQIKMVASQLKATQEDVTKWRGRFAEAYDGMDEGWDSLGGQISDSLSSFVDDVLAVTMFKFGFNNGAGNSRSSGSFGSSGSSRFEVCVLGAEDTGAAPSTYSQTNREFSGDERVGLALLNGKLGQIFRKYRQSLASKTNPEDLSGDTGLGDNLNTFLDYVSEPFDSDRVQQDIKTPVLQLIRRVRETAQTIESAQKEWRTAGKAKEFQAKMDEHIAAATCLEAMAGQILNLPPVQPATPFDDAGAVRDMYTSEKELTQSEARLSRLEDLYEEKMEKQAQLTANLKRVMDEISTVSATAKSNNVALEVLQNLQILVADLENEWEKLAIFFVAMEKRFSESLGGKVKSIMAAGHVSKSAGAAMFTSLLGASGETELLNRMARKYFEFSGKHIVPNLSQISRMLTADVSSQARLSAKLEEGAKAASNALEIIIRQEKENFKNAIAERRTEVRDTYAPLLTNVPTEFKDEVSEAVNKGMTAVATLEMSEPSALALAAAPRGGRSLRHVEGKLVQRHTLISTPNSYRLLPADGSPALLCSME